MSWKDYLYALLAGSAGVAVYLVAKFVYKRLKSGRWDWIFDEKERRDLLEAAEKIVREHEEAEKNKKDKGEE